MPCCVWPTAALVRNVALRTHVPSVWRAEHGKCLRNAPPTVTFRNYCMSQSCCTDIKLSCNFKICKFYCSISVFWQNLYEICWSVGWGISEALPMLRSPNGRYMRSQRDISEEWGCRPQRFGNFPPRSLLAAYFAPYCGGSNQSARQLPEIYHSPVAAVPWVLEISENSIS